MDVCVPGLCLVCGRHYRPGEVSGHRLGRFCALCPRCREACRPAECSNRCRRCGISLPRFLDVCERCRREEFSFTRAAAVHRYAGIPAMVIQAFKFRRHHSLGRFLAVQLLPLAIVAAGGGGVIVPVPSSPRSVRRRGFSGAEVIACNLARATGLTVRTLLRARAGADQKSLTYLARRDHAYHSISLARRADVPPSVLLIDDVFTTGATADSCSRRLLEAGAREVVVLVYASEY